MNAPVVCPYSDVQGRHALWSVYRFRWPWGLIFPRVRRCLFCGAKPPFVDDVPPEVKQAARDAFRGDRP